MISLALSKRTNTVMLMTAPGNNCQACRHGKLTSDCGQLSTWMKTNSFKLNADLANILSKDNHTNHIVMKNKDLVLYRESFVFRGAVMRNRLNLTMRKETKIKNFKNNLRGWVGENVGRFTDLLSSLFLHMRFPLSHIFQGFSLRTNQLLILYMQRLHREVYYSYL